jgi:polyphosphate kinase 2 (PPK2 family)
LDSAGKDGATGHVMSGVNLQGCQCSASTTHRPGTRARLPLADRRCLPGRGRVKIFNRSYYEDVLIARVHPEILHGHGLPAELIEDKMIWEKPQLESFRSQL